MLKINSDQAAAGRFAADLHRHVGELIAPGVNLLDVEAEIAKHIKKSGMAPAFLGYKGYPAVSCLSVNSTVVHGIPRDYTLKEGDVLSVDLGIAKNGWIVDTAVSHPVGKISPEVEKLLEVTERALDEAIKVAKPGNRVGDIGAKIQEIVESNGFFIIKELTGHGVGRELQMPPSIPNFGVSGKGVRLEEGMVLAIEPITALRPVKVIVEDDNWTIRSREDVVCAHYEHTIFIGAGGPVILTRRP